MSAEVLDRIVTTKDAAHEAAKLAYVHAQAIMLNGKPARIVCQEHEADRSLAQNRYYFGVVLKEISEQARLEGKRYTSEAWHIHAKQQFLGYEFKKIVLPGKKRFSVFRQLKSTTGLSVKAFSEYLEKVTAFAVTDLGVRFSVSQEEHRG